MKDNNPVPLHCTPLCTRGLPDDPGQQIPAAAYKLFDVMRKKLHYLDGYADGSDNLGLRRWIDDTRRQLNAFEGLLDQAGFLARPSFVAAKSADGDKAQEGGDDAT